MEKEAEDYKSRQICSPQSRLVKQLLVAAVLAYMSSMDAVQAALAQET